MGGALDFALKILQVLPGLIAAGKDVTQLITDTSQRVQEMRDQNRDPTPGEWDDLNAQIDSLRGRLHSDDT